MSENVLNILRVSDMEYDGIYGLNSIIHLNDEFLCRSLTRKDKAIEEGKYKLRLNKECEMYKKYTSPNFKYKDVVKAHDGEGMIEIIVPNRSFLFFHIGNYPSDSEGCELIIKSFVEFGGSYSMRTYVEFYTKIMPLIKAGKLTECSVEDL